MKPMQVVIIFVLCLLLGVFLFFERGKSTTADSDEKSITTLKEDELVKCEFAFSDGRTVVVEKNGELYTLLKPVKARADASQMKSIFSSLCNLKAMRVLKNIDLSKNKQIYGLDKPKATVKLWKKNSGLPVTLTFGKSNPLTYSTYLMKESDPLLYTIGDYVQSSFSMTTENFRDQKVVPQSVKDIDSFTIQLKGEKRVLTHKNGEWRFENPFTWRADNTKVSDLLKKIRDLTVDTFIDDEEITLDPLLITITLRQKNVAAPLRITIANKGSKDDNVYAKVNSDNYFITINREKLKDFMVSPNSLIDSKILAGYSFAYHQLDLQKGKLKRSFLKNDDNTWNLGDQKLNKEQSKLVDDLLDSMDNLKAKTFFFNPQNTPLLDVKNLYRLELKRDADQPAEHIEFYPEATSKKKKRFVVKVPEQLPPAEIKAGTGNQLQTKFEKLLKIE